MEEDNEKLVIYNSEEDPHQSLTMLASDLILPASRMVRNTFVLFRSLTVCHALLEQPKPRQDDYSPYQHGDYSLVRDPKPGTPVNLGLDS